MDGITNAVDAVSMIRYINIRVVLSYVILFSQFCKDFLVK